ncbi:flagellar basal body-associated FliL family protein [Pseudoroseicyclus aestuarii]|uniref:Flagellar protein FliL n=1 Tax=Pseudoroseicyclus aestuarii TaxID=1795041 RepID=A0A318T304_9RHOB|nr:flagellar basal body-associated FliL family protein [Pseudoroseicyclus aestuarii]PYE84594.1 flagellar FliL protein [Pseudoroseicyclus aestuarii]
MSAAADVEGAEEAPKKKSKLPLILGIVLLLAGAGGGFFAASSGLIGGGGEAEEPADQLEAEPAPLAPAVFVPLDPLVINLPARSGRNLLRFSAQLEVPPEHAESVEAIRPRIVDVLNGYLRAVEVSDLADPAALVRLRGQMLRRVQVVAGEGRVRDLLVMEFVVN